MPKTGIEGKQGTSRAMSRPPSSKPISPSGNETSVSAGSGSGIITPSGSAVTPRPVVRPKPLAPQGVNSAQTRETVRASSLLMEQKKLASLESNINALDSFINHSFMSVLDKCSAMALTDLPSDRKGIRLYELTRLMLSKNEDTYEKMVSLYASMYSMRATIGIILHSTGEMTHVYLCTCCNDGGVAATLMRDSILGHFPGSRLEQKTAPEVETIMESIGRMPVNTWGSVQINNKYVKSVSIVPSRRKEEQENHDIKLSAQGIEKLIDGMIGRKYTIFFLADPVAPEEAEACKRGFEQLYTMLSPFAKETVSYGENESDATNYSLSVNMSESISEGISKTFGTSHTKGTSKGKGGNRGNSSSMGGYGFSNGSCWNSGTNQSDTTTHSSGTTSGSQSGKSTGETSGDSHTTGSTRTVNLTREIKTVQNSLKRLDSEIQRIEANRGFGIWNCCCYVIADSIDEVSVASSSVQSLLCGDADYGSSSYINAWNCNAQAGDSANVLKCLSYMRHPVFSYKPNPASSIGEQLVTASLMVSGRDLPTLLNLPRRSVPGLQVSTMAEFGRNFPRDFSPVRPIEFGNIMHMGMIEKTRIIFDLDRFASHCFICGASGSGKSNTTYNLLQNFKEKKVPFLVIEPVKGEYKIEFAGMDGLQIFTCRSDNYRMFSVNPFEFDSNVHIKEHLDHLNSVVTTCWPLYGPMPAMLKDAFEEAYIACGWDLDLSERIVRKGKEFPTFEDVLPAIERIIDQSTYSGETKGDYKGALCMRIRMLLNGFEGQIFGNVRGVPDSELFDQSAIVDLSNIGNPETRALIMGILIIKLREYRFSNQKETNSSLRHITVLEEAHNILKRCSHESSQDSGNVQGAAVSALVDCIAEMRSCGEGFMIIDQSPSAVDEAALKNTAIKIVMRLPEKNDCEAVANTMGLTEEQARELTRFDKGVAAVFHEGWNEAVLGKMGTIWAQTAHAKTYRAKKVPQLRRNDMLRMKGAVVQWMCAKYLDDEMDEMENMHSVDSLIRKLQSGHYAVSVSENVWKDIRQQINLFLYELRASFDSSLDDLTAREKVELRQKFGFFFRKFLQIDGMFRLCPLSLPNYKETNISKVIGEGPTGQQLATIKQWWNEIKEMFSSYVLFPISGNATPLQWSSNTMDGEYIKFAIQLILYSFGRDYTKSHSGLSIYECAYFTLSETFLK